MSNEVVQLSSGGSHIAGGESEKYILAAFDSVSSTSGPADGEGQLETGESNDGPFPESSLSSAGYGNSSGGHLSESTALYNAAVVAGAQAAMALGRVSGTASALAAAEARARVRRLTGTDAAGPALKTGDIHDPSANLDADFGSSKLNAGALQAHNQVFRAGQGSADMLVPTTGSYRLTPAPDDTQSWERAAAAPEQDVQLQPGACQFAGEQASAIGSCSRRRTRISSSADNRASSSDLSDIEGRGRERFESMVAPTNFRMEDDGDDGDDETRGPPARQMIRDFSTWMNGLTQRGAEAMDSTNDCQRAPDAGAAAASLPAQAKAADVLPEVQSERMSSTDTVKWQGDIVQRSPPMERRALPAESPFSGSRASRATSTREAELLRQAEIIDEEEKRALAAASKAAEARARVQAMLDQLASAPADDENMKTSALQASAPSGSMELASAPSCDLAGWPLLPGEAAVDGGPENPPTAMPRFLAHPLRESFAGSSPDLRDDIGARMAVPEEIDEEDAADHRFQYSESGEEDCTAGCTGEEAASDQDDGPIDRAELEGTQTLSLAATLRLLRREMQQQDSPSNSKDPLPQVKAIRRSPPPFPPAAPPAAPHPAAAQPLEALGSLGEPWEPPPESSAGAAGCVSGEAAAKACESEEGSGFLVRAAGTGASDDISGSVPRASVVDMIARFTPPAAIGHRPSSEVSLHDDGSDIASTGSCSSLPASGRRGVGAKAGGRDTGIAGPWVRSAAGASSAGTDRGQLLRGSGKGGGRTSTPGRASRGLLGSASPSGRRSLGAKRPPPAPRSEATVPSTGSVIVAAGSGEPDYKDESYVLAAFG